MRKVSIEILNHLLKVIVQMLTLPGQWDRNYWGSGSKLLQNESVLMDTTVKYIRELLEFFEEFGISDFENS